MKWTLPVPVGYKLDAVVESHGWVQLQPFRRLDPAGLSCIIAPPRSRPVEVSVRQPRRNLSITAARELSARQKQHVDERLVWMLGLDSNLQPFYKVARNEPSLAHAEEKGYGRLLRSPSVFEDVVKTILTTNTTWAGTQRMVSRLVETLGTPLPEDRSRRAFPTPKQVAGAPVENLRKDVGLGYRAPYISELASRVVADEVDLESYRHSSLSTAELRRELMSIAGVGPYAAATLLMLLERYDYLPIDSWALRLVSTEFHGGEPVGKREVEAAFENWGEWKGLAYWFWDWELLRQLRGDT
ncbi:MAG: hypothetical protein R3178_00880 [Rhodothermales bacterium]|nr:hypothetical protein [Rhodothermales bacterium]